MTRVTQRVNDEAKIWSICNRTLNCLAQGGGPWRAELESQLGHNEFMDSVRKFKEGMEATGKDIGLHMCT